MPKCNAVSCATQTECDNAYGEDNNYCCGTMVTVNNLGFNTTTNECVVASDEPYTIHANGLNYTMACSLAEVVRAVGAVAAIVGACLVA